MDGRRAKRKFAIYTRLVVSICTSSRRIKAAGYNRRNRILLAHWIVYCTNTYHSIPVADPYHHCPPTFPLPTDPHLRSWP